MFIAAGDAVDAYRAICDHLALSFGILTGDAVVDAPSLTSSPRGSYPPTGPDIDRAMVRYLQVGADDAMDQRRHVGGWPDMRLSLAERRLIYRPPSAREVPPEPPAQQALVLGDPVAKPKKGKPGPDLGGFVKRPSRRNDGPQIDGGHVGHAFGPPRQFRVLALGDPAFIDGWADRVRELGIRVDEPLRGVNAGEAHELARRFVAETPAWRSGEEPEDHGYTRSEQLEWFLAPGVDDFPSMDDLLEGTAA